MKKIMAEYKKFWNPTSEELRNSRITRIDTWDQETQDHLKLILWNEVKGVKGVALEIGCGIGRMMKPMSEWFDRVIGVDFSPAMIDGSVGYLADCPNTEVKQIQDDLTFDIASNSVDLVYSIITFQHIPWSNTIRSYLIEALRVLKPGGILRVQTHKGRPSGWNKTYAYRGHYFLDLEKFERFIRNSGFEIIEGQRKLGHNNWLWVTARKSYDL